MCDKHQTNRHFWKCPECLSFCAVEGHCPDKLNCGHCQVAMSYMGRVRQDRLVRTEERCACDARCTNATGPNCDCSCGGLNHGTQAVVQVVVDCGPVPVASIRPSAQTLWDLKEYKALRSALQEELKTLQNDRSQYLQCQKIIGAIWKASTMTSHAGRMRILRDVIKPGTKKPQQTALF